MYLSYTYINTFDSYVLYEYYMKYCTNIIQDIVRGNIRGINGILYKLLYEVASEGKDCPARNVFSDFWYCVVSFRDAERRHVRSHAERGNEE